MPRHSRKRKSKKCSSCKSEALIDPQEAHECPKCDALFCCETCYLTGSSECCNDTLKEKQNQSWEEKIYDYILLILKAITFVVFATVSARAFFTEYEVFKE